MRKIAVVLFIVLLTAGSLFAGDSSLDLNISGFIKFDSYYDTRQVVSAREGHFLLYPKGIDKDASGHDLNDVNNINMVNFQSRLRVKTTAPDALGAKVSGLIEADFFGASGGNENELRLRHATVKLDWGKSQLQIGQYWSPLFTTAVFPQTVSFNTGMPFQPFARNPQVRFTTKAGDRISLVAAASMQRDAYQESGGRAKQQMSGLPGFHLRAEVGSSTALIGAGGHLRSIRHSLTDDVMTSTVFTGYGKLILDGLALRGKIIYGGDMTDQLMLGGYASVKDLTDLSVEQRPLTTLSTWGDVNISGPAFSLGLFAGYSSNLGLKDDLGTLEELVSFSARSPQIVDIWRLSPRLVINSGKLRFAFELEATSALYGSDNEPNLAPKEAGGDERVTNIRGLFATYLFF